MSEVLHVRVENGYNRFAYIDPGFTKRRAIYNIQEFFKLLNNNYLKHHNVTANLLFIYHSKFSTYTLNRLLKSIIFLLGLL